MFEFVKINQQEQCEIEEHGEWGYFVDLDMESDERMSYSKKKNFYYKGGPAISSYQVNKIYTITEDSDENGDWYDSVTAHKKNDDYHHEYGCEYIYKYNQEVEKNNELKNDNNLYKKGFYACLILGISAASLSIALL
jgi:hypothetical protein